MSQSQETTETTVKLTSNLQQFQEGSNNVYMFPKVHFEVSKMGIVHLTSVYRCRGRFASSSILHHSWDYNSVLLVRLQVSQCRVADLNVYCQRICPWTGAGHDEVVRNIFHPWSFGPANIKGSCFRTANYNVLWRRDHWEKCTFVYRLLKEERIDKTYESQRQA